MLSLAFDNSDPFLCSCKAELQKKEKHNMKRQYFSLAICLMLATGNLFAQTSQSKRLFIPFLDEASQGNVDVNICDLNQGQPCPMEYTNVLSNTNLFTPEEQKIISKVFVKYKNVTTNSGPPGSELTNLYKTNYVIKAMNKIFTNENWVANFQYTNFEAREEIRFGQGLLAEFRNKSNDGYGVSFTQTGGGTFLNFWEIKDGLPNGLLVRFDDKHPQGMAWNYQLANFTNCSLVEYSQHTNGMVLGKFFVWNPRNNNLMLKAEFKEPYDWQKNMAQFPRE
jgi:hypothetical protein